MRGLDRQLEPELARAFFGVLSCGLMLVDRRGRILAANPMVRVLLGSDSSVTDRTCCEVFGCRGPGFPVEGACLTEETLRSGRLHKLSVRLSRNGGVTPFLVSSAPIDEDHLVVEVEAATPRRGPRRRTPKGGVSVFMLGSTRLEDEHGSIGQSWLQHRSGELLKLLIAERQRVVPVDEIAETLWPNSGPLGRGNVRQCVYEVRGRVDPDSRGRARSSLIIGHRGGYSIDRSRIRVDCDEFEDQLSRGLAAFRGDDHELAERHLSDGMSLYRGEFMEDEPYCHWALEERTRLAGLAGEALRALTLIAAYRHDYDDAARHLERLSALDGYDVDVQRALIAMCMARGRRSEARRRYMTLCSRLRHDFGEEPGFALSDVRVQRGVLGELLAV